MKKNCKYTKRDQPNFAKDLSVLQFQMVHSIQIWVVDQAEQNKGHLTGIKDKGTFNIYVKCEGGMSKYDNMMVIEGRGVCQNMTFDDNRGGGSDKPPKCMT